MESCVWRTGDSYPNRCSKCDELYDWPYVRKCDWCCGYICDGCCIKQPGKDRRVFGRYCSKPCCDQDVEMYNT